MSSTIGDGSKHYISLDVAKKMTKKYRDDKGKIIKDEYKDKNILPICETFERGAFDTLLAQPGCVGVRAYYSMDDDKNVHLIIVGVNEKNEDILPAPAPTSDTFAAGSLSDGGGEILENASRCPSECPPTSPLNE
jgi:hypothetical protein